MIVKLLLWLLRIFYSTLNILYTYIFIFLLLVLLLFVRVINCLIFTFSMILLLITGAILLLSSSLVFTKLRG